MKLIPELESGNVTLAIENHFDLTPSELNKLISEIDHPLVKICIDPLNSISLLWGGNETFDQLKKHVVSAHVKDVKMARKGAGFLISGCPLGEGIADVENYLSKIHQVNPSCNVFIEQWMDTQESESMTILVEKDWVEKGIQYLSQAIKKITEQGV